ncbi:MAG: hypothetical protein DBX91_08595 [Subdoligranulum variabile]|nr:MAG: hypothetical protein DBX91_08595 [Subdoligranulum variabile]
MIEQELRDLICSRYKSVRAFAEAADLPYTTVDSILKRGIEKATVKSIIKLCQTLNIDTDELAAGRIAARKILLKTAISPEENRLLLKIRSLNEDALQVVLSVIDLAYEVPKQSILNSQIIPFKVSEQPASAGTGTYLGPDGFGEMLVDPDQVAGADFGVPVSGDSMEPRYRDGDIILVSMADPVEVGDIALVTMDGCGYVKMIGEGELISLNKRYAPIPMTDDIRINGKVIGVLDSSR